MYSQLNFGRIKIKISHYTVSSFHWCWLLVSVRGLVNGGDAGLLLASGKLLAPTFQWYLEVGGGGGGGGRQASR